MSRCFTTKYITIAFNRFLTLMDLLKPNILCLLSIDGKTISFIVD